ncbi:hypothetical protein HaLaN_32566, partial [Haematococcus lacustris]
LQRWPWCWCMRHCASCTLQPRQWASSHQMV